MSFKAVYQSADQAVFETFSTPGATVKGYYVTGIYDDELTEFEGMIGNATRLVITQREADLLGLDVGRGDHVVIPEHSITTTVSHIEKENGVIYLYLD